MKIADILSVDADLLFKVYGVGSVLLGIGWLQPRFRPVLIQLIFLHNSVLLLVSLLQLFLFCRSGVLIWYHGVQYEHYALINRATGPYAYAFVFFAITNLLLPQLLWIRTFRKSVFASLALGLLSFILHNLEFWILKAIHHHSDYLPSSWVRIIHPAEIAATLIVYSVIFTLLYFLYRKRLPVYPSGEKNK